MLNIRGPSTRKFCMAEPYLPLGMAGEEVEDEEGKDEEDEVGETHTVESLLRCTSSYR